MSDNTYKQIVDVAVGDYVKSYNEKSGNIESGIIERKISHENTIDMARINFTDGTSVEFNAYHPMMTRDGWKSLTGYNGLPILSDSDLLLSSDNDYVSIASIDRWIGEPITTYNLDVEENDNFFVSRSGVSVLAKNIC